MQHAIVQLGIALDVVLNNAPINEAEGNMEQAALERRCAADYRQTIEVLRRQ